MSGAARDTTRRVAFVSRYPTGESLRSARAVQALDGVHLLGICERPPETDGAAVFADVVCVDDTHDPAQLIDAAHRLARKHGALHQLATVRETLLNPVAQAREALGLPGMRVATVNRALDKSLLKRVLEQAGLRTAPDRMITGDDDARAFIDEVGFPIVLKPLGGSGGLATWRIRDHEQLALALDLIQPAPDNAVLAEACLPGRELCIDTITIDDEPQFFSICCYRPSILDALENPALQWRCVMPRDLSADIYRDFIDQGLTAIRALKVGHAMTHMEGFLLDDGGLCFTDATLRPAGARIAPMLAFAYDIDPYRAWARVAVDGCFDGPWSRNYAVGTLFLRGMGSGTVKQVDGIETVRQRLGAMLVDGRPPRVGSARAVTYTGDGYVTVRHPETQVVKETLDWIAETIHVTYSHPAPSASVNGARPARWAHLLQYFDKQLYKPAWDDDALPRLNEA